MQTILIVIAIWIAWALLSWVLHAFKFLVVIALIATAVVLWNERKGRQRP